MTLTVNRHGDSRRITLGPQLTVANRQELKEAVLTELGGGARKFLIDLDRTTYIDSAGLGVLVSVAKKVRDQRGELRLLNLSDELRTLFRLTLLDKLFAFDTDARPGDDTTAGRRAPLEARPGPRYGSVQGEAPPRDEGPPA